MHRVGGATIGVPDNTALLLRHITLEEGDYRRLLSLGFGLRQCTTLAELRSLVATDAPERLVEFDAVVQAHQAAQASAR